MKLRKSIAAGVAAVAMTFASTSVATAQETATPVVDNAVANFQNTDESTTPEAQSSSDVDSKEILGWISVATAAIGALGTLITFVQKFIVK
ncbi:hypothetical protein [Corynebacterium endometrii]|uniref:Secreted protein n=1 Tax=Corynebacterium endometrii TaxID=2488819 RepID=A0A4P7QG45_9CORY|nr:hypothetical protein [Corynebacterium endometrii]QCB28543.1 hypothetical protein CENDO_06320 [Corynebacterium endometrii]